MANTTTIILKNSGTSGNTPNASNLQFGEIAINYADGKLFYKNPSNEVLEISGSGGGGGGEVANTANAAYDQANLAFDKANSANIIASAAFDKANIAAQNAFATIIANGISLVADSNNDTLTILTTGNVSITADADGDNLTFDLTTTGVVANTYGSNTTIPVFVVDSRGRLTSVTNTTIDTTIATAAFAKANGAAQNAFGIIVANGVSLLSDSNNDTLTIRTTGNVAITADAAGDNLTFDLTTTGVVTNTYGSNTVIPVFVVDSRGRLTSVTNTSIDNTIALAAFNQANNAFSNAVLKTGNTMTGPLVMAAGVGSSSSNSGSIVVQGGVGVSGNVYISNSSSYGFSNIANVSVARIQYNSACNSIDFIFG